MAMGTMVSAAVDASSRAEGLQISERITRAVEATTDRVSTWQRGSELSGCNRVPVGEDCIPGVQLSAELARVWHWAEATNGAFHPAIGPLVELWGLRSGGRHAWPTDAERNAARAACAGFLIENLAAGIRLQRTHSDAWIDAGGFGKGAALDAALAELPSSVAVRVDFGGQLAWSRAAREERIAIADPRGRDRDAVASIDIRPPCSLATSGNSERGVRVDGRRVGHLLDPRTGLPAPDFGSVSVLTTRAIDADCLSTALFVLGPDGALAFAAARPGIDVVVAEAGDDDSLHLRATASLRGRLHSEFPIRFVDAESTARPTPDTSRKAPR